jgi:uncharacterized protein YbjT (DUF2867 family)
MRRALVAGATGYLGGFVAREFKRRGYVVRALARSPEKLEEIRESLDEIVVGEITKPATLQGICDDIDVVFSSVGITRQKDGLTFRDVDYQGNANLLEEAVRAGVEKFVYVSVFKGPERPQLAIVKAHEDFVNELRSSGIDSAVVRPTGYFSDLSEILEMAKKGRVYLVGQGTTRSNPIHGADLAVVCVDAVEGDGAEIDVGGPEVMSYREIAELAFRSLGKPAQITEMPVWVMRWLIAATRLVNSHQAELLAFFTNAMTADAVAPRHGTRRLEDHFSEICGEASP